MALDKEKESELLAKGYNDAKAGEDRSTTDMGIGERILIGTVLGGPVGAVIAVFVPSPSRDTTEQTVYDRGYQMGERDRDREIISDLRRNTKKS